MPIHHSFEQMKHLIHTSAPLARDGPQARSREVRKVPVECSKKIKRGLQLVPWTLLLLHDQSCKALCHGGHGTSRTSCIGSIRAAHSMPWPYGPSSALRGYDKLKLSVTTQERGAGSNRLPFLKSHQYTSTTHAQLMVLVNYMQYAAHSQSSRKRR